jgi:integrase
MTKRQKPSASGDGKEAGEGGVRAQADAIIDQIKALGPNGLEAIKRKLAERAAHPLLSGPSSGPVLHGEILPPKPKRSRAVAQAIAGKGLTTDVQVKAAGPGIHKIADATGLMLKVGDKGEGSFVWRYRFGGRRREIGLGSRKDVKLADALKRVAEQRVLRDRDIDPIDERRRVREEIATKERAAKPVTFREMTERFVAEHAPGWIHRYARQAWLSPMVAYAYPVIGQKGVDVIDIADVRAVIAATKKAGQKLGEKVRSKVEQVINAAIAEGHRSDAKLNPASIKLHKHKKIAAVHFRTVDLDHAPGIFRELRARLETSTALAAWVFMILTALRPSEALNSQWDDIDWDKRLLKVSADRMKAGVEHIVPLSSAALEVLARQARVRTGDSVFPGRGGSPLSYATFFVAPAKAGIAAATPHGWRSVFRDYCGDVAEDVPRDLAEAALAHSLVSVEASYRRRTAVERRRPIMEAYAAWLNGGSGARVVSLDDRRRA